MILISKVFGRIRVMSKQNSLIDFLFFVKDLFASGSDFSSATIDKNRNLYYQNQLSQEIQSSVNKIIRMTTEAFKVHMNIGQDLMINSSSVFVSYETLNRVLLNNKFISTIGEANIRISSNLSIASVDENQAVSIRVENQIRSLRLKRNFKRTLLSFSPWFNRWLRVIEILRIYRRICHERFL